MPPNSSPATAIRWTALFVTGERTIEGFFPSRAGSTLRLPVGSRTRPTPICCGARRRSPILNEARKFSNAIHAQYPGKLLAYNCSPSFHWRAKLNEWEISQFQQELRRMGYRFQFVTLAGFHALNLSAFELAHEYACLGMPAYSQLQQREFELAEKFGYGAVNTRSSSAPAISTTSPTQLQQAGHQSARFPDLLRKSSSTRQRDGR